MSTFISFRPHDAHLPTFIRFALTKKAYEQICQQCNDGLEMLTEFSQSKVLTAVKTKEDNTIKIHTAQGYFFCKENGDNLLITGFYKNSLLDQNIVLKYGVYFQVSDGIIVQIKLQQPYDYYFDIVNGKRYFEKEFADRCALDAIWAMLDRVSQANEEEEEEAEVDEEEYTPEMKLAYLLQTAENYSILSSELEEQNANIMGNIAYTGIEPADYDRTDRVAYQFGVSGLDENIFKVGVQVEIEDKEQSRHSAEIIELIKADPDSPASAIVLLFNDHISKSHFYNNGFFSLSFSCVNKDVQLAANERIRTGEAKAKYMDAVLGRNIPAGFEKKDLSQVTAKLQQKKYPPNQSQMDAICSGINTKDVFLVMGPPGTGKTTVILEWVKYFVTQEHKRVLVSSQNNKAVDNVLARIADEKDIDVIRIGSEAKLQSDVIPYMFENKVAALRSTIAENTEKNSRIIGEIIHQWGEYIWLFDPICLLKEQEEAAWEALTLAVRQRIKPAYQLLQKQLADFNNAKHKKLDLYIQISELETKLNKHRTASNGLNKFFSGLTYKKNLSALRSAAQQLEMTVKTEKELATAYQVTLENYQAELAQCEKTLFQDWWEKKSQFDTDFRKLQEKPLRPETDIWDLFSASRSYPLRSLADLDGLYKQIKDEIENARYIQAVLCEWGENIDTKQNYALNEIVLESVDLVGATCIGINSQKRFSNLDFDVTIIDEAGQIQVHNALVPMSVSNKLIMLGDHKQIPPTTDQALVDLCEQNGVDTEMLEKSLFEIMYEELPQSNKMMLDTQYRMPAQIADTISEWFYEGKYYSPEFKRGLKSLIPKLSDMPYVIIDTSDAEGRREVTDPAGGSSNPLETAIITNIIRHLHEQTEADLKEVGVISAYKAQIKLIKNKLGEFLPRELVSEMAATLDSYQGQERDIILYSFTKSADKDPKRRRIGFLNELRRLNVAMTRCKKMLILIGDMEFLRSCRHCDTDAYGEEIYNKSERQFSDFINKMLKDVDNGRGERISYHTFLSRIKGGDA